MYFRQLMILDILRMRKPFKMSHFPLFSQSNGALINTEHGELRRKNGLEKKSDLHKREGLKDKRERMDKDGETCESGEREVGGGRVAESDGVMQHLAVVECETDAAQWRVRGQWCL